MDTWCEHLKLSYGMLLVDWLVVQVFLVVKVEAGFCETLLIHSYKWMDG